MTKVAITNGGAGPRVATITKVGTVVRTNANVKCAVTRKLKRGTYRFRVYVLDIAGDAGRRG